MEENKENKEVEEEKIFVDHEENFGDKSLGNFKPGEFYDVNKGLDLSSTLENVEKERLVFFEFVRRWDVIKKMGLAIFLIILGGSTLWLIIDKTMTSVLFIPLLLIFAFFVIAILIFLFFYKQKRNYMFNQYKFRYFLNLDSYVFSKIGYSDIELSYNTQYEEDNYKCLDVYDSVYKVITRDYVKGKIYGVNFSSSELIIKTGDEKNSVSPFCGRLYNINLINNKDLKLVLFLKKSGKGQPTNLQGLEPLSIKGLSDSFKVYATNNKIESLLNQKTVTTLNNLKVDECIDDVIIEINKERVLVSFSYIDDYMKIPYESPLKEQYLKRYEEDANFILLLVMDFLSNKNFSK